MTPTSQFGASGCPDIATSLIIIKAGGERGICCGPSSTAGWLADWLVAVSARSGKEQIRFGCQQRTVFMGPGNAFASRCGGHMEFDGP